MTVTQAEAFMKINSVLKMAKKTPQTKAKKHSFTFAEIKKEKHLFILFRN